MRILRRALIMLFLSLSSFGLSNKMYIEAQETMPPKTVRLNRAPVSDAVLRVHLPRAVKRVLSNGMSVLVLENHHVAEISVNISIDGAGGLFDPSTAPGLANMTAQMLTQGTERRSSEEIARVIDMQGATLNVVAGQTSASASLLASGLSDTVVQWFPVLADVMLHPSFQADELADARLRQLARLKAQNAGPGFLAAKYLHKSLYGDTPEGVVSATPESTAAFEPEGLREFYELHYVPQNTMLIIEGDITPSRAYSMVSSAFENWKKTDAKVLIPAVTSDTPARTVTLVDRPKSVQTNLTLGRLAIDRRDPDYVALAVTDNILGAGAAGRLFMRLREEKSYTYGANSFLDAEDYRGYVGAQSNVRSSVTGEALDEFFHEFQRLGTEEVSPLELSRHKHALVAAFALSLEQPESLMSYLRIREHYGFPEDYWDKYAVQIANVTAKKVMEMGAKYYSIDKMQLVAVGDPSIKSTIAKWGEVHEVKP